MITEENKQKIMDAVRVSGRHWHSAKEKVL